MYSNAVELDAPHIFSKDHFQIYQIDFEKNKNYNFLLLKMYKT